MGGKNLIVMIWWQVIGGVVECLCLLNMYYDGVGEVVQQYYQVQYYVYDVDFFVVDVGELFFLQIVLDVVIGQCF